MKHRADRRRVVVTGIGVVSPIGCDIASFYSGLRGGRQGIGQIEHFDASGFTVRIAGEVKQLDFGQIALPDRYRQALKRDRKQLFALAAAEQALDSAFSGPVTTDYRAEKRAVLLGAGLEICHLQDVLPYVHNGIADATAISDISEQNETFARFQLPSDLAARCLAQNIDAMGLFSVNLSACAAGTQALGEAYLAIAEGAADMALAGGYDSMLNPLGLGGFCLLEALSTSNHLLGGASRPFDTDRDGFVLGEGAAMCVFEDYTMARQRGATIYGEILGYDTHLDAYRLTDPAPDQVGAIAAMAGALESAGLQPQDIDYINAHGTATRQNDPMETAAIHSVFGRRASTIPVSSSKSQFGHLIGAAGAVEFVVGLFALSEQMLPATINLNQPDRECDLDYVPNEPRPTSVSCFMSNSFGFGGQNASIIARACG